MADFDAEWDEFLAVEARTTRVRTVNSDIRATEIDVDVLVPLTAL